MVQSAIKDWITSQDLDTEEIFFYCCFFVNNQYRILVEGDGAGSTEDLEQTFANRLQAIGKVVVLMDSWDQHHYLTRICTIYEQFMAIKLDIPVSILLPSHQRASLVKELEAGVSNVSRRRS